MILEAGKDGRKSCAKSANTSSAMGDLDPGHPTSNRHKMGSSQRTILGGGEKVGSRLIHHVDKVLSLVPTETFDHLDLVAV